VIGYDPDNVIVEDPLVGRRVMPVQHFVGAWKHTTDMEGNDMRVACPVCKGTGKILFFPCDICGGSGFQMDFMNQLLFVTDIHPMTLIVPYKSLNEH
jgi:hypothetical protein